MDKIARIRQKIKELRELIDDHNYYLDNPEQALGYGLALDDIEKLLDTNKSWINAKAEVPDSTRDIIIMWGDNGITNGFYEDGEFFDHGGYSSTPNEDIWWMEIPELE